MPDPGALSRKSLILSESRSASPSRTSAASLALMAAPEGLPLLGCEHVEPLRNPVRKPLPQLVREPLPDDAADRGALLGCQRGQPVRRPRRISPDTLSLTMPDAGALSLKSLILSESRSASPSRTSAASLALMAALTASRCSGVSIVKLVRKPVCKPLPQLVRELLPDDAADGGPLLGREHGRAALRGL